MSITKAEILTRVNANLAAAFTEAQIDAALADIIRDICVQAPGIVQKTGSVTIAAGGYSGTMPTDFVGPRALAVHDSNGKPLDEAASLAALLAMRAATVTASTPKRFYITPNGATIYVHPGSLAGCTLTVYYNYESAATGTIVLPDAAKLAVEYGVTMKMQLQRGTIQEAMAAGAVTFWTLYQAQVTALKGRYS